ncbi:hypothetical protein, partial [uncultured Bilophila sp.]|uniref:hypothetical protein n=1 Tax=uncultured Bilophila sp. TaxID=529385 RepID=UPI0025D30427
RVEVTFLGRPHVADEDGETGNLLSHVSLQKKESPISGLFRFAFVGGDAYGYHRMVGPVPF